MLPHIRFKTRWSFHRFHWLCSTPAAFATLALVLDQYKQAECKGCWARMSRHLRHRKTDDIVTSQLSIHSANVGRQAGLLIQTWAISYYMKLTQCRAENFSSAAQGSHLCVLVCPVAVVIHRSALSCRGGSSEWDVCRTAVLAQTVILAAKSQTEPPSLFFLYPRCSLSTAQCLPSASSLSCFNDKTHVRL